MSDDSWTRAALFANLSAEELALVAPCFETVTRPAHAAVIAEGEPGDDMFLLVAGKVRVSKSPALVPKRPA